MEKNSKKKKHALQKKSPVAAAIVGMIINMLGVSILAFLINLPISMIWSGYPMAEGFIGVLLAVMIFAFLYKLWYKPEFMGMLQDGDMKQGFKMLFPPLLIYWLITTIIPMLVNGGTTAFHLSLAAFSTAVLAGFMEEFVFRGVCISCLLYVWKDKNEFLPAAVLSGIFFSFIHCINLFVGANPGMTIIQVLEAILWGIFVAAVFMRCGNLLPMMIAHTIHDIIGFGFASDVTDNGIIKGGVAWDSYLDLALRIVLAAIGIYMIKKSYNEKLREVWNHKWQIQEPKIRTLVTKFAT